MEEGIDELLFNKTLVEDVSEGHFIWEFTLLLVMCTIGISSAVIMMVAIRSNKCMHNRTNLVLFLYLMCSVANLIMLPVLISTLEWKVTFMMHCLVDLSDFIIQFLEMAIMLMLLSNTIMETEKISDKNLIRVVCAALGTCLMVVVVLCICDSAYTLVYSAFSLVQLFLLVGTVAKDIYTFFKRKTAPLNFDQKFRLAVVRIYIYILFGVTTIIDLSRGRLGIFLFEFVCMTPTFIMMYAYWVDERYKVCIMNLFRKKEDRRSIDARICLVDENSVTDVEC